MRTIDADELIKLFPDNGEGAWTYNLTAQGYIIAMPTVDQWHYPSRGELPDKDWTKHPDNVSKECFVVTKRGVGTIARWDNDYKTWFEKNPHLPVLEVIAWYYFVPPEGA